ncbi:MAG: hypothetical protein HOF21_07940, partial [Nitrospina sp.]|nr:hypothetical protein [Nitrospina sp.]
KALDIISPLFPERKIIPIPCKILIWGLGGIHCLTQQQPQGAISSTSKEADPSKE